MQWIFDWHGRASAGTIAIARRSQALVIETVDRLVHLMCDRATVNRLLNAQLDAMDAVWGDPTQLMEQSYDALQDMVALHREFTRRLLEVIDKRDDRMLAGAHTSDHGQLATVHPLRTGGRSA